MQQWIIFAVIAMVIFSFSNLALKNVTSKVDFNVFKPLLLPVIISLLVFALLAAYVFTSQSIPVPKNEIILLVGVIIASLIGFILFLKSLQTGDVAIVTAILSLSTVVVAALSIFVFGAKYAIKEIAAMLLAIISIIVLVL